MTPPFLDLLDGYHIYIYIYIPLGSPRSGHPGFLHPPRPRCHRSSPPHPFNRESKKELGALPEAPGAVKVSQKTPQTQRPGKPKKGLFVVHFISFHFRSRETRLRADEGVLLLSPQKRKNPIVASDRSVRSTARSPDRSVRSLLVVRPGAPT